MLVLTHKLNQSINIAMTWRSVVVEIRGDQVRLGINAPKEVAVHRKEIRVQVQAEKAAGTRER